MLKTAAPHEGSSESQFEPGGSLFNWNQLASFDCVSRFSLTLSIYDGSALVKSLPASGHCQFNLGIPSANVEF